MPRPPLVLAVGMLAFAAWAAGFPGGAAAAATARAPDPLTCEGYAEPRVFLESQGWWMRTPGKAGTDFGHVHVGTCFPWAQRITGNVHFDVRVVMHENPGTFRKLRLQIFQAAPDREWAQGLRCADTCTWWIPIDVDTSRATKDGCQEFRIQAFVDEPDGNTTLVTNGWRANLVNAKPLDPYCDARAYNFTEGRGWYGDFGGQDFGYENARLEEPLPLVPLSGIWRPTVKLAPGAGGVPATHHSAHIDPNFHAGDPGRVVKNGSGSFGGDLAIDTTGLSDGAHRLVLRTDADTTAGSTLSGLLVVPFTVANGELPPPPPPPPPVDPRGCTVVGTPRKDVLEGTPATDVICALGGNDDIRGLAGDDIAYGDDGHDTIRGGAGNERLHGGAGDDRLYGGAEGDLLYGGAGRDSLYGEDGPDTFYAQDGARDLLIGGTGSDRAEADRRLDRFRSVEAFF